MTTRDRIVYGYATLRMVEVVRAMTGDQRACDQIEHFIVRRELADLAIIAELEEVDAQIAAIRRQKGALVR